jgi:hypothetical protein
MRAVFWVSEQYVDNDADTYYEKVDNV